LRGEAAACAAVDLRQARVIGPDFTALHAAFSPADGLLAPAQVIGRSAFRHDPSAGNRCERRQEVWDTSQSAQVPVRP
jgi:hypothetical protein